jgi:hypothetical protein
MSTAATILLSPTLISDGEKKTPLKPGSSQLKAPAIKKPIAILLFTGRILCLCPASVGGLVFCREK